MTPADYDYLCKFLKERSGLDLSADKQYLVESRLVPLARKANLSGIDQLVQRLKAGAEPIAADVVDAMTTNETFFFRDKTPFDHLRQTIMPALLKARAERRALRIWCAAASTGQEPYSIAMCLKEMAPTLAGWRVDILGTDLSQEVLNKSKAGIYTQFEVQRGLPIQLLVKYFKQVGDSWQLDPEIRAMIQFKKFNLLHDFGQLGKFDLIFCRNVLIYFDQATKSTIFNQLAKSLDADGFLALGAAESVVGLTEAFRPHPECRGIYRPTSMLTPLRASPSIVPAMSSSLPSSSPSSFKVASPALLRVVPGPGIRFDPASPELKNPAVSGGAFFRNLIYIRSGRNPKQES